MRKTSLSLIERETIINFNEAEQLAEVSTYNASLKGQLAGLAEKGLAQFEAADKEGWQKYLVPKGFVCIKPPKDKG